MLLNIIVNNKKNPSHAGAVAGNKEVRNKKYASNYFLKTLQISWVLILSIISKF